MPRRIRAGIILAFASALQWPAQGLAQSLPTARDVALSRQAPITSSRLSIIWRVDDPERDGNESAGHYNAFSADGKYVGVVRPSSALRLLDAADGSLLDELRPKSNQRLSYSMALANTGRVAIGRQGSMEVFDVHAGVPIAVFPCPEAFCLPISLAFSPDGSLLALHEVTPFQERQDLGRILVVDLDFGEPTRMEASAGLTKTSFSSKARPVSTAEAENEDTSRFRIWHTSDWQLPRSMLGSGWTVGSVPVDSLEAPTRTVAVYSSGSGHLVMRDFSDDRLLWTAPLVPPQFAPADSSATRSELDRSEIAPNGRFLISYESPIASEPASDTAGAIVVRRTLDGAIVAVYDVSGVLDLAIAPDSRTFVYSAGAPQQHTALARVPVL